MARLTGGIKERKRKEGNIYDICIYYIGVIWHTDVSVVMN